MSLDADHVPSIIPITEAIARAPHIAPPAPRTAASAEADRCWHLWKHYEREGNGPLAVLYENRWRAARGVTE